MNQVIDSLRADYQRIQAPPDLRLRLRARLPDSRPRQVTLWWAVPIAATIVLATSVVLLRGADTELQPSPLNPTSLSNLSGMDDLRPQMVLPSLSQISSGAVPALPEKPATPGVP